MPGTVVPGIAFLLFGRQLNLRRYFAIANA
jgi:hypothetical protein